MVFAIIDRDIVCTIPVTVSVLKPLDVTRLPYGRFSRTRAAMTSGRNGLPITPAGLAPFAGTLRAARATWFGPPPGNPAARG